MAIAEAVQGLSITPDWEPWLLFFLRSLQRQKLRLIEKIDQNRLMLGSLSALDQNVVELARTHGRIEVAGILLATGANRSTIKIHLASLVRRGILARHGQGRGTWYAIQ